MLFFFNINDFVDNKLVSKKILDQFLIYVSHYNFLIFFIVLNFVIFLKVL